MSIVACKSRKIAYIRKLRGSAQMIHNRLFKKAMTWFSKKKEMNYAISFILFCPRTKVKIKYLFQEIVENRSRYYKIKIFGIYLFQVLIINLRQLFVINSFERPV